MPPTTLLAICLTHGYHLLLLQVELMHFSCWSLARFGMRTREFVQREMLSSIHALVHKLRWQVMVLISCLIDIGASDGLIIIELIWFDKRCCCICGGVQSPLQL